MSDTSVKLDYRPATPNDCIPDSTMNEVVSRIVAIVGPIQAGVAFSVTPPTNKNVIWVPLDSNGNRVGPDRRYDFSINQWVDDNEASEFCAVAGNDNLLEKQGDCWLVRRRIYEAINFTVTNNNQQSFTLAVPITSGNYIVNIFPTSDPGTTRVWFVSKTTGTVTIGVAGWTTGTQNFRLEVLEV